MGDRSDRSVVSSYFYGRGDRCLCLYALSGGERGALCLHTFMVREVGVCVFMRCLGDRCCLFHTYIVREIGVVCVFRRCLGDRCCLFHTYTVREIGVVFVFRRCVGDRCCRCVHILFCQGSGGR